MGVATGRRFVSFEIDGFCAEGFERIVDAFQDERLRIFGTTRSAAQLESSKGRETYRRALHAAAEDARANASQLVSTLDARLGRVISINSGSSQQVPVPRTAGAKVMAAQSEAVQSYNAADLSFNAVVTVVFELTE